MLKLLFCATVSFMSFNCTGLCNDVNVKFLSDQLNNKSVDIGMIQETWLSEDRENILSSVNANYMFCAQSGMDTRRDIMKGRPYGGVAIMWHKRIAGTILPSKSNSNRMCAVIMKPSDQFKILIVCVYICPVT